MDNDTPRALADAPQQTKKLSDYVGTNPAPVVSKPKSLADAVGRVTEGVPTAEEQAALDSEDDDETGGEEAADGETEPSADADAIPDWMVLPEDFKIPPGRQLYFVRFRARWTDTPQKGDRVCLVWSHTDSDEKLALKRTRGDSNLMLSELTKQMIRIVDGQKADWTRGAASNVERFWHDIGAKCRKQLQALYHKLHSLDDKERADFFGNCLVVRSAGG